MSETRRPIKLIGLNMTAMITIAYIGIPLPPLLLQEPRHGKMYNIFRILFYAE